MAQLRPGSSFPLGALRFLDRYGSTRYCLKFPKTAKSAYRGMMAAAAVVALDPTFRMPCYLKGHYDGYATKLYFAMLLPLGLLLLVALWAAVEAAISAVVARSKRNANLRRLRQHRHGAVRPHRLHIFSGMALLAATLGQLSDNGVFARTTRG